MPIIHTSPLPDIDLTRSTITEYVMRLADDLADEPAVIEGLGGRTLSFSQLEGQIYSMAGGLAARGFGRGDTLALMAPNMPEFPVVFHAVATAGGTITTINHTYGVDEIRFQLHDSGASLLVVHEGSVAPALEAVEGTAVEEIFTIGEVGGCTALSALFADPIEQAVVDTSGDVVALPYSSGTTGLPKGVMLTHDNLVANIQQCQQALACKAGEVALTVLPFFHIYGMQILMNEMLAHGVTIVTTPRFDLAEALTLIEAYRVTRLFAVPPIVLALAKDPMVDNFDLSSLEHVVSGAAPLGGDVGDRAAERIGCDVTQGFGMTELSPTTHLTPVGQYRRGSVGVALPHVECRIVDAETDEDQGPGNRGELFVRGPMVMKGYLNSPEATAATIDGDGWLHTGDIAVIDEEGHMYIVDRVKELIKFRGFQVPPAELEALIVTHPAVVDVAVVGVEDSEVGERPKAFVVIAPGKEVTASEIQEFVKQHVATYKQVHLVDFVDAIPRSSSGKILRRQLRSLDQTT